MYGASIGSHNGGLDNPNTNSLVPTDYDYWHWGPDEALDTTQPGYSSGAAYARASLQQSFQDIDGWLAGVDNGRAGCGAAGTCPRLWVSPAFNSTREESYQILEDLGVITLGEQKLSVFPHWTVSTQVNGKRFQHLNQSVSEWILDDVVQSLDGHTTASLDEAIDFYYALGALINIYNHNASDQNAMIQHYISQVSAKPRSWSTNAVGVYDWWVKRSGVSITPSYTLDGASARAHVLVSGSSDAETAIELVLPGWGSGQVTDLHVFLNGSAAGSGSFRTTDYGVKVKVGTTVSNVDVCYSVGTGGTGNCSTATFTPTATQGGQATFTPTATQVGQVSFPTTGVLDTFNRANGTIGSSWAGDTSGYSIAANQLDVGEGGMITWQQTNFGADQEAYLTMKGVDTQGSEQDLLLKNPGYLELVGWGY